LPPNEINEKDTESERREKEKPEKVPEHSLPEVLKKCTLVKAAPELKEEVVTHAYMPGPFTPGVEKDENG